MFANEQLVEILAALPDPSFILTRSGRYADVFGGSDARYYHDGSGLVGLSISDVLNDKKAAWFLDQIDQALRSRKLHIVEYSLAGSDVRGLPAEGPQDIIHFEGRVQALGFQVDCEDAVLWVASNITNRHQLEEQLRALSETDSLTGLWNRRYFGKIVETEKERAKRYGHPVSLLIFDIDLFKVINDTYGHNAGDAVLVELAKVVCGSIRESDIVTRWGGEEFTILMPYANLDTAAEVAEKIRRVVETHRFPHGYKVTISLGVAEWALATESFNTLLLRADEALYQAKSSGRNRSVLSLPEVARPSSTNKPALNRLVWRAHYESGDAMIDQQHKALFDGAQTLLNMVPDLFLKPLGEVEHAEMIALIDGLTADAVEHFETEERTLEKLAWPNLKEHQAEHNQLKSRALALRHKLFEYPTEQTATELINFITVDVVANHMLRSDRKFFSLFGDSRRA